VKKPVEPKLQYWLGELTPGTKDSRLWNLIMKKDTWRQQFRSLLRLLENNPSYKKWQEQFPLLKFIKIKMGTLWLS